MESRALTRVQGAEALGRVARLFDGWDETLIWSALQGLMGSVWTFGGEEPRSAIGHNGDFGFVDGEPDADLVRAFDEQYDGRFYILTYRDERWAPLIAACCGERAKPVTRYAIRKEGDVFDRERLEALARALPEGVTMARIDDALYERCLALGWACDFVSQFGSAENYAEHGLGFAAVKDGEPVGGASSYIYYRGGIEIEVDTREDMRRQGIATACAARLVLSCLERGLYPSWDAANRMSVGLAEKLGYHEKGPYPAFHINE